MKDAPICDFYVYAWKRPDTGEIFYIGKGRKDRDTRRKLSNLLFMNVIEKLRREGLSASTLRLHEGLSESEAFAMERMEIAARGRKTLGTGPLTNLTDGGEGTSGGVRSLETRKKMSASKMGLKQSPEHRENNRLARLGSKHSEDTIAKMRLAHTGITNSPESVARANLTKRMSPPKSGMKGVNFNKGRNKWEAKMRFGGIQTFLGRFDTQAEAGRAYDLSAVSMWGVGNCYLNFPLEAGIARSGE